MKAGAHDYLTKPFDNDELCIVVARALEFSRMHLELSQLSQLVASEARCGRLTGRSLPMRKVIEMSHLVASTNVTVLIGGESGTGKEFLAASIHEASPRADKTFVAVDCAILAEALVESSLFGHVKGSFTDAKESRQGKFEAAQGGTLFLDEIGNLSLAVQAKLLRVIQERTIERVGNNKAILLDVRILAATNVDLMAAIGAGRFREDLFHRLNEFRIVLPPLRERGDDVILLAHVFVEEFAKLLGKEQVSRISDAAMRLLLLHPWPGNVRQLRNEIKGGVLLCRGDTLDVGHLSPDFTAATRQAETGGPSSSIQRLAYQGLTMKAATHMARIDLEQQLIKTALAKTGGRRGTTAKRLGVDTKTLYSKMKAYGIKWSA